MRSIQDKRSQVVKVVVSALFVLANATVTIYASGCVSIIHSAPRAVELESNRVQLSAEMNRPRLSSACECSIIQY